MCWLLGRSTGYFQASVCQILSHFCKCLDVLVVVEYIHFMYWWWNCMQGLFSTLWLTCKTFYKTFIHIFLYKINQQSNVYVNSLVLWLLVICTLCGNVEQLYSCQCLCEKVVFWCSADSPGMGRTLYPCCGVQKHEQFPALVCNCVWKLQLVGRNAEVGVMNKMNMERFVQTFCCGQTNCLRAAKTNLSNITPHEEFMKTGHTFFCQYM